MRKSIAIVLMLVLALGLAELATAADVVLDTTVQSATEGVTKTGSPYIRFIIQEERSKVVGGVDHPYTVEVVVMCFKEDLLPKARELSSGSRLHAIAQPKQYQGSTNYRILKFLE